MPDELSDIIGTLAAMIEGMSTKKTNYTAVTTTGNTITRNSTNPDYAFIVVGEVARPYAEIKAILSLTNGKFTRAHQHQCIGESDVAFTTSKETAERLLAVYQVKFRHAELITLTDANKS